MTLFTSYFCYSIGISSSYLIGFTASYGLERENNNYDRVKSNSLIIGYIIKLILI